MIFELEVLTARFLVETPVSFPAGTAANVFRGALGLALNAEIFAPKLETGPSGLADPPRPFVFRVEHLNGCHFEAGQQFDVRVHLFHPELVPPFEQAFRQAAQAGLGPLRGRSSLVHLESLPVRLDLLAQPEPFQRASVEFLTPTELKHQGSISARPEFAILFGRARDRVSTLRALYGGGAVDLDFGGLGERAQSIELVRLDLQDVERKRRSSKTGQVHPLDGFTGFAEYAGELAEFWPILEAAQFTGVGRQTVWGKGAIAIHQLR